MPNLAPHMRDDLARAAFEMFADRGIRAVSVDDVAAALGVTKGSVYWHFRSKKELILAAAAFYYREWLQKAHAEIAAAPGSPVEQIRRVWRMSVEMCLFDRARRTFSTELFAMGLHDAELRASWSQFYDSVRELHVGLLQAAHNAGQLVADDPSQTVDWLLATFEGIKFRATFQPQMCTAEQRDAIVAGLMTMLEGAQVGAAL